MKHCGIALETLADYQEGRGDAIAATQIRVHMDQNCPHCLQNLAWLHHAKETLLKAYSVPVPEKALASAHAIFRERVRPAQVPNTILSWLASLQFDSRRSSPALAGARGAKPGGIHQVYSTDAHDIELFQEPAEHANWIVIGQVMSHEGTETIIPHQVVLTGRDGTRLSFQPDAEEFHLPSIPPGLYEMALHLTEGTITVPAVGVGL